MGLLQLPTQLPQPARIARQITPDGWHSRIRSLRDSLLRSHMPFQPAPPAAVVRQLNGRSGSYREFMVQNIDNPATGPKPLYAEYQVTGAAAIGGPFASAWLLALNYSRLNRDAGIRVAVALGFLATAGLYVIVSVLPTDTPPVIGPAASAFFFWLIYKFNLRAPYAAHIESGGTRASHWKVAGVSIAAIPLTLASVILLQSLAPIPPLNQVKYGASAVIYEGRATREEARALGNLLQDEGVFREGDPLRIVLKRPRHYDDRYVEEIVVSWLASSAPASGSEEFQFLDALRKSIRREIFPRARVFFEFRNTFGALLSRIPET